MAETNAVRERDGIPEHLTWDLSRVYADWDAWEADVARVEAGVEEVLRLDDDHIVIAGAMARAEAEGLVVGVVRAGQDPSIATLGFRIVAARAAPAKAAAKKD